MKRRLVRKSLWRELKRYLPALLVAVSLIFLLFWIAAKITVMVNPPHRDFNDYTVGRKLDLCGHDVDIRHVGGGYDLGLWRDRRCESLSRLDQCVLECLAEAGTIPIGAACYSDCFGE
ncbi:MAG: hypothetical protein VCB25_10630 [Myxococcota bacterium]